MITDFRCLFSIFFQATAGKSSYIYARRERVRAATRARIDRAHGRELTRRGERVRKSGHRDQLPPLTKSILCGIIDLRELYSKTPSQGKALIEVKVN